MAKKSLEDAVYEVTFAGTYRGTAKIQSGLDEFPYEVTVTQTQKMINHERTGSPLALFKKQADKIMHNNSEYPGYVSLHEFRVVDAKRTDCDDPIMDTRLMSRERLEEYIDDEGIPVEVKLYKDNGEIVSAIAKHKKDPEGFVKGQDTLRERRGPLNNLEDLIDEQLASAKPKAAAKSKGKSKKDDSLDI